MKKRCAILTGMVMLLSRTLFAQTEATQYFMTSIPQVSVNNPAFVPRYNYSIGLPGISSVAVSYSNNGFSYGDMITRSQNDVKADLSKWVKALSAQNYVTTTAQVDLLRIGFRVSPKMYFQVSSTAIGYSRVRIPKDAATLFVDGAIPASGTQTQFSAEGDGIMYLETAVGAAYQVSDRLALGTRFKYLSGLTSVKTESASMDVAVGTSQLSAASELRVRTSGVQDFDQSLAEAFTNSGFAIDLGATYKATDKLTLAASVVDLGKIHWVSNVYSYSLDKNSSQYSFSGIEFNEVVNGHAGYVDAQMDSMADKFTPAESPSGSYGTALPLRVFVSASYELMKDLSAGGLFFTENFKGHASPGVSVSMTRHFGKWLSLLGSYTISNRSYNNVGMGVSFNFKPIQLYFVGDNLLRAPVSLLTNEGINSYVDNTKLFNLRVGLNIVWGRDKKLDKITMKDDPGYLKVRKKK